jgi:hypothetical protein
MPQSAIRETPVTLLPDAGLWVCAKPTALAAEALFVVNQRVDQGNAPWNWRAVQLVILGGEPGEILGFFIEHDRQPRQRARIYRTARHGGSPRCGMEDRGVRS